YDRCRCGGGVGSPWLGNGEAVGQVECASCTQGPTHTQSVGAGISGMPRATPLKLRALSPHAGPSWPSPFPLLASIATCFRELRRNPRKPPASPFRPDDGRFQSERDEEDNYDRQPRNDINESQPPRNVPSEEETAEKEHQFAMRPCKPSALREPKASRPSASD